MSRPPLVVYHAQCRDGWAAAWAARKAYPDAELRPTMYGTPPPSHAETGGRKVIVADFCYSRNEMKSLAASTFVRVLDHHKTAEAALDGLDDELRHMGLSIDVTFDMNRSGAGIVWDELVAPREAGGGLCPECAGALHGYKVHDPGCPSRAPWLIRYVEDRDLWRWALPNSREINAYISTLPYGRPEHFEAWDAAERMSLEEAIQAGKVARSAIQRYAEAVCENAVTRTIDGHAVPSVNAPQHDISEVLERLMDEHPEATFVHGWWQRSDRMFSQSLRSRGEFDVSVIAKANGGGGHKNAAGFQTQEVL